MSFVIAKKRSLGTQKHFQMQQNSISIIMQFNFRMKTRSPGIPLNCSIVAPICRSIKHALMTFHEKHNIENKWPNIQIQNKNTSIERY